MHGCFVRCGDEKEDHTRFWVWFLLWCLLVLLIFTMSGLIACAKQACCYDAWLQLVKCCPCVRACFPEIQ